MHSIIVGVGNPLLGDDSAGIEAVRNLRRLGYDVKEATAGGLELAEMIAEYDFAIIVDAFHGKGVKRIDIEEYEESVANHDISFPSAYKILSKYVKMPEVVIIGIGIENVEIGGKISKTARKNIATAVEMIKKIMEGKNAS